jgi:hypothetical protein
MRIAQDQLCNLDFLAPMGVPTGAGPGATSILSLVTPAIYLRHGPRQGNRAPNPESRAGQMGARG